MYETEFRPFAITKYAAEILNQGSISKPVTAYELLASLNERAGPRSAEKQSYGKTKHSPACGCTNG